MKSVPLRRRLLLLAVAGILPIALMSGFGLFALFEQQREQASRAGLEIARALATAVDAELNRSFAVLHELTNSASLDRGDVQVFDGRARRAAATHPHWLAIILADPSGKPIVDTAIPHGEHVPPLVDPASFEVAVRLRKPVVGYLSPGTGGVFAIPLRVPVMRDGRLLYVLTAAVKPNAIVDVVNRQRVPPDWVVSVFDAHGLRVARSNAHEEWIGTPAAPSLRDLMATDALEGTGVTTTLGGDTGYTAFSKLAHNGWSVAITIPRAQVDAAAWRSLAAYAGGITLSIVVGVLATLLIARSINRPIAELGEAAHALGRGARIERPRTDVAEIEEVADALVNAALQLARGAAEREELLRRETAARAAAESANRAKDEFLAMLGHELRNPLGAISNAAAVLQYPGLPEDRKRNAMEIVARQVGHLARLTDDLLDAGRAMMGKIVLQRRPLDLATAAAQALATLKAAGRTSAHRVVEDYRSAWVEADAIRIDQIVANLVINAVKYTRVGGTVRVTVCREGRESVLRVADDGIGMTPELAARVFELFVQGDRELDRSQGGLGIGLTLVRRLAEMHGGAVSVYSEGPDRGSEFVVRLPAIEPPQPGEAPRDRRARVTGLEVLVVEDNDDARESLVHLLELEGHRVRTAADGVEGVDSALASPPDVALIDIGLPKIDGYEVARRMRAADLHARLVALTGYGLPEDRERALAAGFDAHLVKPVRAGVLEEVLANLHDQAEAS